MIVKVVPGLWGSRKSVHCLVFVGPGCELDVVFLVGGEKWKTWNLDNEIVFIPGMWAFIY